MGYTYEVGLGVKQDYKKAEGWYLKAASQGDHRSIDAIKALTNDGLI
jgi:TPR repeat protein